jgi:hypothetical protein
MTKPASALEPCAVWSRAFRFVLAALCLSAILEARAQLAITEVMSWASTNCPCAEIDSCHPDFWELTNFGTDPIDLTGYLFSDQNADFPRAAERLEGITIKPNESIIFVREGRLEVPDAAGFRAWWGEANLPPDLQIFFYPRPGFDELGDAVRLADPNMNTVDEVYFGATKRGATFSYETVFGRVIQSELGVCGAFQAARCADVGSPGWAVCGHVPLRITEQPIGQTIDAGNAVTFRIRATGLPRPRFRWYFNGQPLSDANASTSSIPRLVAFAGCGPAWVEKPVPPDLTLLNAQPWQAGEYFVEVLNGLETLTSAVVRLTVNSSPRPLVLGCPASPTCIPGQSGSPSPVALVVAPGQSATFSIVTHGYPLPTFQWSRSPNGRDFIELPDETNRDLVIPSTGAAEAGIYRVRAQNFHSTLDASAALVVKPKPRLKVTEVMSDPCRADGCDWWELTNVGDEPVDLCGYRWDDRPAYIGAGPTIERSVVVQPGESVILLEGRTPEFFRQWWGERNLPRGLQFISYTANSLERERDELTLWNPTATLESDWVDAVSISTAIPGASFWFAPADPCSEFGIASVDGECGAFRSADGCDVGSPGWTPWTPPCLTSIRNERNNVRLEWRAQIGSTCLIEYSDGLGSNATAWSELERLPSLPGGTVLNTPAGQKAQRFYRVRTIATATCADCP